MLYTYDSETPFKKKKNFYYSNMFDIKAEKEMPMTHPIYTTHILSDNFQWITEKHANTVVKAAETSDLVVILVTEADAHRSIINPFSFEERSELIKSVFSDLWAEDRLRIVSVPTRLYSDNDESYAMQAICHLLDQLNLDTTQPDIEIKVQGQLMEEAAAASGAWELVRASVKAPLEQSSLIENYLLSDEPIDASDPMGRFLRTFRQTEAFKELQNECQDKHSILTKFGTGPFDTADAICTYNDKVLLITRKNPPFRHCYATPGGLLDPNEDALTAAIRELLEETEMRVPTYLLTGGQTSADASWDVVTEEFLRERVRNQTPTQFDSSTRDPRGDYRANAFWFDLSDLPTPPKVIGRDDANKAEWIPIDELTTSKMAFDHYAILCRLGVARYPEEIAKTSYEDITSLSFR